MIWDLVRQRALIWAFAQRDFSTRYRSSALGWAWSLVQPLTTLLIYAAVFSIVFRIQAPPLGSDPERNSFAAFLFTGLVTYNVFAGLVNLSMVQLKGSGDLLKKVRFPAWAPVLGAAVVQLAQILFEFLVLVAVLLVLGNWSWTWLLALPILMGAAFLGQGIGFLVAIPNVKYGDVQAMVTVALQALYFLTPILYPLSFIDGVASGFKNVVLWNPLTWYVESMHDVMYSLTVPTWWVIPALLAGGFLVFLMGFSVFSRSSRDIGELF